MGLLDPKKISTQEHLDIEDIIDDLVVLTNGRVSVVIETSSLNFELLDSKEQDSRIYSFAAFLNSIKFPLQIVIRTQKTDISRYLKLLDKYKTSLQSEAIVDQVNLYQEFINGLTQSTQILDKRFFVVVPSVQLPIITRSWVRELFGGKQKISNINSVVQKAKEELYPKRDHVLRQLANMGVTAKQLKTDELIKLYYSVYEPDIRGLDSINVTEEQLERGITQGKDE